MNDNRRYIHKDLRNEIDKVLASPSVHQYAKDMLLRGLTKDCLDAARDASMVARILQQVSNDLCGK